MKNAKLTLYDKERIIIEFYTKIIEIKEDLIIIDQYIINGSKLIIKKMDKCIIEIEGQIKNIVLGENNV